MNYNDLAKKHVDLDRRVDEADKYTAQYGFVNDFQTSDHAYNAFYHAYVSAAIAYEQGQQVSKSVGEAREIAGGFADLRKFLAGEIDRKRLYKHSREMQRDKFGNEIGLKIARYARANGLPYSALGPLVADAVRRSVVVRNHLSDPRVSWYGYDDPVYDGPAPETLHELRSIPSKQSPNVPTPSPSSGRSRQGSGYGAPPRSPTSFAPAAPGSSFASELPASPLRLSAIIRALDSQRG